MFAKRISLAGAAALAVTGLTPLAAEANLIAYEGFDYAATEDIGAATTTGGSGWAASAEWTVAAGAPDVNGFGLSYDNPGGNDLQVIGNSLGFNEANNLRLKRQLASNLTPTAGQTRTIWVSFLMQHTGTNGFAYAGPGDNAGTPNAFAEPHIAMGKGFSNATQSQARPYGDSASDTPTIGTSNANTTYLLLAKWVISTEGDGLDVDVDGEYWQFQSGVDALPTALPTSPTATTGTNDRSLVFPMDSFWLFNGNVGTNTIPTNWPDITFDEIRIGDEWSDVIVLVPEPGSFALMGLGGLAMLKRRRAV